MKIFSKVTLIVVSIFLNLSPSNLHAHKTAKKKILILSSKGGAGHMSASQTLCSLFEKEYDIKIVYPTETLFTQFDFLRKIAKDCTWEQIHNKLFQNGYNRVMNFYAYVYAHNIAPLLVKDHEKKFEKMLPAIS